MTHVQRATVGTTADLQIPTEVTSPLDTSLKLAELGEELGEYKAYDSQLAIAEVAGTRITKCLYQLSPKTGKKLQENSYVRIPVKHLTEEIIVARIAELSPYVLAWLQDLEDKAIREEHKGGLLRLYTDKLDLDRLIESLEASEAGARLNKDKIEAWFAMDLADSLALAFAEKMELSDNPSTEELEKLEFILNAYKSKFSSLASGKTFIKEADCIAMISVIRAASAEESLIGKRFIARLEKMQEKEDSLLLSL